MKTLNALVLAALLTVSLVLPVCTPVYASGHDKLSAQETYLGKLEFQGQTITKKTAGFLHRQILLQRATQLVSWAMPMMNFYQLYPAMLSNQKMREDDVFFSLCDGYNGVYPPTVYFRGAGTWVWKKATRSCSGSSWGIQSRLY